MRKIIGLMLVFTLIIIGCTNATDLDNGAGDFSVISLENIENEDVLNWYEENHQEFGYYIYETEEASYLLIAAGERVTGGYSILLEDEQFSNGKFSAKALLDEPEEDDMVIMVLTYPALLLEFPGTSNLEVELDISDLEIEEAEEGQLSQVLARFNGQIDANSIEIDTTLSYQLQDMTSDEQVMALRLSEEILIEQMDIIESIGIEDLMLFNAYMDEHGRLVLVEILEVGYGTENHTIGGIYTGRADSNFIEVAVDSFPVVFMLHMELEEEIHGEIESGEEIIIQYAINENGQRVVKDFIVK